MRIALVCPYSLDQPGGVANQVLGFADWLASQGFPVDVIAPGRRQQWARPGIRVHRLGAALGTRFNGSTAQLGLLPSQARKARQIIATADVVHVHEPLTPGIGYAAAKAAKNLVVTHHAAFQPSRLLAAVLRRRAASLGERTSLAVSQVAAQTAQAVTGQLPQIIPNAIQLPAPPLPRTGFRGGPLPRIGFIGRRDDPRKGFVQFVALSERAARAGIKAEFVAAGPGKSWAKGVHDVGELSETGRLAWLQSIDVLVAPNLTGESFGLVLLEGLAAGCDVLASGLPAFKHVLQQAGVGRVFPPKDLDAALAQLQQAIKDPIDPLQAHQAASAWDWSRLGPRLLAVLQARAEAQSGPD